MDLGLSGRTAALPAASAGLGFGAAAALVVEGVSVAICGRHADRVDAAADRLRALAGDHEGAPTVVGLVGDVSNPEGSAAFVHQAIETLGQVDILVANAGGPPAGGFADTPLAAYQPALDANLLSVVAACQEAIPPMQERRWGRVVAITSHTVRQPNPRLILSNTARAGTTAFLKTLSTEVAGHGITVNSVQPGLHATDRLRQIQGGDLSAAAAQVPAGIVGDPADFGRVVAFLCSESARFITGAGLVVDGGAYSGVF
jgi:3-oxoacyl-[acyl-carrier protein] reductase